MILKFFSNLRTNRGQGKQVLRYMPNLCLSRQYNERKKVIVGISLADLSNDAAESRMVAIGIGVGILVSWWCCCALRFWVPALCPLNMKRVLRSKYRWVILKPP